MSGWTMICPSIPQLILTATAYEGILICFVRTSTGNIDRTYHVRLVKLGKEVNKR